MARKKCTKAKPSGKITEEQFSLFKNECEKWIEFFGLKYWKVRYFNEKIEWDEYPIYGESVFNHNGRCVDICINIEWPQLQKNLTNYNIKQTAFHEAVEVLLYPLRYIAECRYVLGPEEIDCATHNIIRTLENVVFCANHKEKPTKAERWSTNKMCTRPG